MRRFVLSPQLMAPPLMALPLMTLPLAAVAQQAAEPTAQANPSLPVQFVDVKEAPLTFDVTLTGTIEAKDSINLSFPRGGRIAEIMVQAGDRVSAGQALARTDGVQQQQALAQAEASVAAAEATRQQAEQAATRAAEMLRRGVGTRAARDAARQALSAAEGQLASAQTSADQARRAADDTVLSAPQDAVVTARQGEPGQIVGAAQTVLTLAALSGLEAVFQVPDAPELSSAQDAAVSVVPLDRPALQLTGHVTEIAPLVDAATGSVTVRALIDPMPGADAATLDTTLLGAAVAGTVHLPGGTGIEVPWTALTATGDQPAVWKIAADRTVAVVPVEIERFNTGSVVVRSGIAPGDQVVGEGSQLMYPGRPVSPGKVREMSPQR